MEEILRNKDIFKIIPFDYEQNILFFPIRHHSPACSYHLIKTIEKYKPDCILVEGPQNANRLIPILTDEDTAMPIAFYYFYKDKGKLIDENADSYKCYYPFLNTSPEYNALLEAKRLNITGSFIDLPYGEILINTKANTGIRKESEIPSYNDDYYLSESKVFNAICEKTHMRSFEEFWEKFFEIDALFMDTEDFVARMMSYCYLTRQNTPQNIMENDGCLVRESFMSKNILEAAKTHKKVLVVTGGFHSYGLYSLINSEKEIKSPKLHHFDEKQQNVYAMAYTLEAADALNGYASGMQNPGFYESVWKKIKTHSDSIETVYENTVFDILLKTAKQASKEKLLITMSDILSAVTMYNGLRLIRDKKSVGLYELYDSVQSCFIKGEVNSASDLPLRILSKIATGSGIGKLCQTEDKIPLIADFEEQCKKYRLKVNIAIEQKVELDIFAKKNHMEISRFFYRMNFLKTGFAKRLKGSDIVNNFDRSRVREIWTYARNISTDTALIDSSAYGATIEEACRIIATRQLRSEQRCSESAKLYVECFLMDIDISAEFAEHMNDIIINDGDFFSIGKAIYYFNMLISLKKLYGIDNSESEYFLEKCFSRIVVMLPSIININSDRAEECIKICRILYNLSCEGILSNRFSELIQAFKDMIEKDNPEPALYGAVLGLLYGYDSNYKSEISNALFGYLTGSDELKKQGAVFLRGAFSTARDIVLVGYEFIKMIDSLINSLSINDFMEVMPELRLAFSKFTPSETDKIAEKAASLYGKSSSDLKKDFVIYDDIYALGVELDKQILEDISMEEEYA